MSTHRTNDTELASRRQAILLAAERLFAEHGFHGVSIRDIAEVAGVPKALVGYHHGTKVGLYHAIYRYRSGFIVERLTGLDAAERDALPAARLEAVVHAFVLPVLRVAADPESRHFLRLMSRGMTDRLVEDEPVIRELFDPLAHAFIDAMAAAIPGVTRARMAWCYQFALGALLAHLNDERIERLSQGEYRTHDGVDPAPLLLDFVSNGIRGACDLPVH